MGRSVVSQGLGEQLGLGKASEIAWWSEVVFGCSCL